MIRSLLELARPRLPRPEHDPASGIAIDDVWASYGDRRVLSGVNLHAKPGSFTAIAGPNGVGKSTLLKLMAGTMKPARGSVRVGGVDIASLPARRRAALVAVVPQDPDLPPATAAVEVVLMGRNPHLGTLSWESAEDLSIALEAMRMTDSERLADRHVDRLSGGERQRVAVALALAQQTPALLLDEPTANLDLAYQPAIMDTLRRQALSGKTVIAAVHDLTLAAQFCDRIALMCDGTVLAEGAPAELITPENIAKAYGARVSVLSHPETGKPIVVSSWR